MLPIRPTMPALTNVMSLKILSPRNVDAWPTNNVVVPLVSIADGVGGGRILALTTHDWSLQAMLESWNVYWWKLMVTH